MVEQLTADDFEKKVIQSQIPVLVDFWASWCGPCRMMAPVFEETSGEYKQKLRFAKISIEEHPEIADLYNVTAVPCLIMFNKGNEADRIVGYMSKEQLKQKINSMLDSL